MRAHIPPSPEWQAAIWLRRQSDRIVQNEHSTLSGAVLWVEEAKQRDATIKAECYETGPEEQCLYV